MKKFHACTKTRVYIIYTLLHSLPDEVSKVFPGGWERAELLRKLNEGFIDQRKRQGEPVATTPQ